MSKLIFLLYNLDLTSSLAFTDIIGIFSHGMKMDLSMVGYLMLFPGVLLSVSFFELSEQLQMVVTKLKNKSRIRLFFMANFNVKI